MTLCIHKIIELEYHSIDQIYFSFHIALSFVALTTTTNNGKLNLTAAITLNFSEEITILLPSSFITVTCTVSPLEVTDLLGFRMYWIG